MPYTLYCQYSLAQQLAVPPTKYSSQTWESSLTPPSLHSSHSFTACYQSHFLNTSHICPSLHPSGNLYSGVFSIPLRYGSDLGYLCFVSGTVWTKTRQLVEQRSHMTFWGFFPCLYLEMGTFVFDGLSLICYCYHQCFPSDDLAQVSRRISSCSIPTSSPASHGYLLFISLQ